MLDNGDEYFTTMLKAIGAARQTVNFASYILHSDEVGRQFRDAFCERAQAGVEVRILLDGIGSSWSLDNSHVRMMREAGCKFAYYHPTASWRVDRTNRRSHRRILVIDGKVAFTGSAGLREDGLVTPRTKTIGLILRSASKDRSSRNLRRCLRNTG